MAFNCLEQAVGKGQGKAGGSTLRGARWSVLVLTVSFRKKNLYIWGRKCTP